MLPAASKPEDIMVLVY